jgi:hypothetical protein
VYSGGRFPNFQGTIRACGIRSTWRHRFRRSGLSPRASARVCALNPAPAGGATGRRGGVAAHAQPTANQRPPRASRRRLLAGGPPPAAHALAGGGPRILESSEIFGGRRRGRRGDVCIFILPWVNAGTCLPPQATNRGSREAANASLVCNLQTAPRLSVERVSECRQAEPAT